MCDRLCCTRFLPPAPFFYTTNMASSAHVPTTYRPEQVAQVPRTGFRQDREQCLHTDRNLALLISQPKTMAMRLAVHTCAKRTRMGISWAKVKWYTSRTGISTQYGRMLGKMAHIARTNAYRPVSCRAAPCAIMSRDRDGGASRQMCRNV